MIEKAIYYLLSNDPTVSGLVGTRIFPDMATQGAVYPFVVYSTEQTQPSDTKDGPSVLDVVSISILTFAKSHITALEIAAAIRAELDRYGGTAAGVDIQSVRFVNQMANQMDLDKHIFIIEQVYEAREVRQ